jgi:hypothetical protein
MKWVVHKEEENRFCSSTGKPLKPRICHWLKDENGDSIALSSRDDSLEKFKLMAKAPEYKLACEGALTALLLDPHVDKQQAIDYLKEVLESAK